MQHFTYDMVVIDTICSFMETRDLLAGPILVNKNWNKAAGQYLDARHFAITSCQSGNISMLKGILVEQQFAPLFIHHLLNVAIRFRQLDMVRLLLEQSDIRKNAHWSTWSIRLAIHAIKSSCLDIFCLILEYIIPTPMNWLHFFNTAMQTSQSETGESSRLFRGVLRCWEKNPCLPVSFEMLADMIICFRGSKELAILWKNRLIRQRLDPKRMLDCAVDLSNKDAIITMIFDMNISLEDVDVIKIMNSVKYCNCTWKLTLLQHEQFRARYGQMWLEKCRWSNGINTFVAKCIENNRVFAYLLS